MFYIKNIKIIVPVLACLALCFFILGCNNVTGGGGGGGTAASWHFVTVESIPFNISNIFPKLTALAFDLDGNPVISYFVNAENTIKYATYDATTGTFSTITAETNVAFVNNGIALGINGAGIPHLVYSNGGVLTLASKEASGIWISQEVDSCSLNDGFGLGFDSGDNVYISYIDTTASPSTLMLAQYSSGGKTLYELNNDNLPTYSSLDMYNDHPYVAFSNSNATHYSIGFVSIESWEPITSEADTNVSDPRYTSLKMDANGNARIAYLDYGNDRIRYAEWNSASGLWSVVTIEANPDGDLLYPSLDLSTTGVPYIAYMSSNSGGDSSLKLAKRSGSTWTIETVDSSTTITGKYCSLVLDSNGNPCISYTDGFKVRYAYWR